MLDELLNANVPQREMAKGAQGMKYSLGNIPFSAFMRELLFILAIILLAGCVSTPEGRKLDPIEGAKRIDENIDVSIEKLQSRTHDDNF